MLPLLITGYSVIVTFGLAHVIFAGVAAKAVFHAEMNLEAALQRPEADPEKAKELEKLSLVP